MLRMYHFRLAENGTSGFGGNNRRVARYAEADQMG